MSISVSGRAVAIAVGAIALIAQATGGPAAEAPSPLPGGASALQETYQDWSVVCDQSPGADGASGKRCAMIQQQYDGKTRQRVLAVEITAAGSGVEAILLLPFGLDLASGVTFQVDDGAPSSRLPYRTCFPSGCLIPFVLDAALLSGMQRGTALNVAAVPDGGGQVSFGVSLKGFSAAHARILELGQ